MGIIKAIKLTYDYIKRDEEGNPDGVKRAVDHVDIDIEAGDVGLDTAPGLLGDVGQFVLDQVLALQRIRPELPGRKLNHVALGKGLCVHLCRLGRFPQFYLVHADAELSLHPGRHAFIQVKFSAGVGFHILYCVNVSQQLRRKGFSRMLQGLSNRRGQGGGLGLLASFLLLHINLGHRIPPAAETPKICVSHYIMERSKSVLSFAPVCSCLRHKK